MKPARQTRSTSCLRKFLEQHAVVDLAVEAFRRDADRIQPALAARSRARGLPARLEITTAISASSRPVGDVVGDRFEIGPAAGEQNPEPLHRYSTRGRPRRAATTSPIRNDGSRILREDRFGASPPTARGTAKIMPTPRLNVRR